MLVDELGRPPDRLDVDSGVVADPGQRLGERLARDPVRGECDRVDGAADQVGAGTGRLERKREPVPAGALAVQADRKPRELAQLGDELAAAVRLEQPGRVVEHDPRGADLGEALGRLEQRVVPGRSVEKPGVELASGGDHRLGGDAQVPGIVQGIVEAEDVDPARRCAGHEPAHEVVADRPRAHEERAADCQHQRGLRAGLDRPDPLPGALGSAADRGVERASAGDLEVGVAGAVEDVREPQQVGGGHRAGERLLREQADRGVDEPWHDRGP